MVTVRRVGGASARGVYPRPGLCQCCRFRIGFIGLHRANRPIVFGQSSFYVRPKPTTQLPPISPVYTETDDGVCCYWQLVVMAMSMLAWCWLFRTQSVWNVHRGARAHTHRTTPLASPSYPNAKALSGGTEQRSASHVAGAEIMVAAVYPRQRTAERMADRRTLTQAARTHPRVNPLPT